MTKNASIDCFSEKEYPQYPNDFMKRPNCSRIHISQAKLSNTLKISGIP